MEDETKLLLTILMEVATVENQIQQNEDKHDGSDIYGSFTWPRLSDKRDTINLAISIDLYWHGRVNLTY